MCSESNIQVYNMFSSYTDSLVDRLGAGSLSSQEFATWGRQENTWSGPGGKQSDGHTDRIDYIFYHLRSQSSVRTAETVHHAVLEKKWRGMSLSDHSWVEADIRITFNI